MLGGVLTFAELLARAARARTSRARGWDATETRRFGRWARRLWDGLLAIEDVVDASDAAVRHPRPAARPA